MRADDKTFIDQLESLAKIDDTMVVREALEGIQAEDLAEAFPRLEFEEGLNLFNKLDADQASEVLVEMPTETARRYVAELPDATVAYYLDILPMDDALDLREELGDERFQALLEVIPQEDADEILRLMAYPEGSVGQLMTEKFFEVKPELTVRQIMADIRKASDEKYETVNDLYVVDDNRKLLGVFSLRKAIRAAQDSTAQELMRTDVVTVQATDTAEDAARTMSRYGFYALPVLDPLSRIVGVFTGDDAQEVLTESETEDVLKLGAVTGSVESYLSLNVWQLVMRRLPWLFFLFLAELLTGTVLRWYVRPDATATGQNIATIAQLMVFLPLLIGAGGNAGSQVTTTVTRALAVGEIKTSDAFTVWRREILAALLIGSVLGGAGFLRALFGWQAGMGISIVVGLALPLIILWAAIVGSVLPLGAKRLKIDPAVMSAPFISTFVDATGLIIYFEIARRVLGLSF